MQRAHVGEQYLAPGMRAKGLPQPGRAQMPGLGLRSALNARAMSPGVVMLTPGGPVG